MSAPGWNLGNQVLRLVHKRVGCTISELAEETAAPVSEVRSACWALVGCRRLDVCWPYFVVALPQAQVTETAG
jgi:hypothetical protein